MDILDPPLNVAVVVDQTLVEIKSSLPYFTASVSALFAFKHCPLDTAVIARAVVAPSVNGAITLLHGGLVSRCAVGDVSVDGDEVVGRRGW